MKYEIDIDEERNALMMRAHRVTDEEGVYDEDATKAAVMARVLDGVDQTIHNDTKRLHDQDIQVAVTDEEIAIAVKAKRAVLGKTSTIKAAVAVEK
ncbi:MAG: hypothetical protein U9Q07_04765 [Planctomycetota bacterium]|nr:hypothetical protein [Planctomycetota bacterium]